MLKNEPVNGKSFAIFFLWKRGETVKKHKILGKTTCETVKQIETVKGTAQVSN
jgi:hypothetical protein